MFLQGYVYSRKIYVKNDGKLFFTSNVKKICADWGQERRQRKPIRFLDWLDKTPSVMRLKKIKQAQHNLNWISPKTRDKIIGKYPIILWAKEGRQNQFIIQFFAPNFNIFSNSFSHHYFNF